MEGSSFRANQLAYLVDAAAYFRAFVHAARTAKQSILILGWDIHSKVELLRGDEAPKHEPLRLGSFLDDLLHKEPELHIHILCWDFAAIYALERELLARVKFDWLHHERLHFELDNRIPGGASHHQKVVVIDDRLCFVGGVDLTVNRWDTPDHDRDDARRERPDGNKYTPFHDLQVMASGPIAQALGDLARKRWLEYNGEKIPKPAQASDDFWPAAVDWHLENAPATIARTVPASEGCDEIRETEYWILHIIQSAKRFLYIENQYLTSAVVCDALEKRLREDNGPEILIVNPAQPSGWLEQASMGVLRARLLRRLQEGDEHNRLLVCYPFNGQLHIYVHAKFILADDSIAYLGSANLSNRSMGFDTECGVVLRASESKQPDDVVQSLRTLRLRLMAEHFGKERSALEKDEANGLGLLELAQEHGFGGERGIRESEVNLPEWLDTIVPDGSVIDPERPIALDEMMNRLLQGTG